MFEGATARLCFLRFKEKVGIGACRRATRGARVDPDGAAWRPAARSPRAGSAPWTSGAQCARTVSRWTHGGPVLGSRSAGCGATLPGGTSSPGAADDRQRRGLRGRASPAPESNDEGPRERGLPVQRPMFEGATAQLCFLRFKEKVGIGACRRAARGARVDPDGAAGMSAARSPRAGGASRATEVHSAHAVSRWAPGHPVGGPKSSDWGSTLQEATSSPSAAEARRRRGLRGRVSPAPGSNDEGLRGCSWVTERPMLPGRSARLSSLRCKGEVHWGRRRRARTAATAATRRAFPRPPGPSAGKRRRGGPRNRLALAAPHEAEGHRTIMRFALSSERPVQPSNTDDTGSPERSLTDRLRGPRRSPSRGMRAAHSQGSVGRRCQAVAPWAGGHWAENGKRGAPYRKGRRRRGRPRPDGAEDCEAAQARRRKAAARGPANAANASSAPCSRGPPRSYAFCVSRRRWESIRTDGRRGAPGSTLAGQPGGLRRTPRAWGVHRALQDRRASTQ